MLRFGPEESAKPRKIVPSHTRVWHLLVMLVITVTLMMWFGFQAWRDESAAGARPDRDDAAIVTAESASSQSTPRADEDDGVRMIEISRLREFVDHDTNPAAEPYYYVLDLARHNPAEWLELHARRDLTWAHLLRDPDRHRGQLVLLRGQLRQLKRDQLDENDYGLSTRYEGSLFTEESGRHAYRVIVSDPPTGIPLGEINEHVTVAGYFLGWWRHTDQLDRPASSPLILGRRFIRHETPERPDVVFARSHGAAIAVVVGVMLLVFLVALVGRRKRRSPVAAALERDSGPLIFDEPPADSIISAEQHREPS